MQKCQRGQSPSSSGGGGTVVDTVVLIEDIGVEARVHAFTRSAGAEAASTAEEDLKRRQGVNVVIVDTEALESDVDMCELEI